MSLSSSSGTNYIKISFIDKSIDVRDVAKLYQDKEEDGSKKVLDDKHETPVLGDFNTIA